MNKYIDVVIFKNVINLDRLYTYEDNLNSSVGDYIIVDFNNSLEIALVLKKYSSEEIFNVKKTLKIINEISPMKKTHINLGLWMREFYILTYAKAFSTISDLTKINKLEYIFLQKKELNENETNILRDINNGISLNKKDQSALNNLIKEEIVTKEVSYSLTSYIDTVFYKFNFNKEQVLEKIRKNATRQLSLIEEIYEKYYSVNYFSSEDFSSLKDYKKNVFDDLLEKDIFEEIDKIQQIEKNNIILTTDQSNIVTDIIKSEENKFLIHGVTGSGKTEIYFKLIEDALKNNKSAMFLVPEIGLTPQMEMRTKEKFGDLVSIIHSKITKSKRVKDLDYLQNGKSKILLGTRSAIFTPMKNIGLIIIDEEHDNSYKLDSHNKYDVREVARYLTETTPDLKLVLGSATPSIETYYKAKNDIYKLYKLTERPNESKLPEIIISDMRKEIEYGNNTSFSIDLRASIKESLNKNKQSLLFLNRRGYSNFVSCRSCGFTINCDKCDVSMVFHKKNNFLKCHYCGDTKASPRLCPQCGSKSIKQFGMGTEKLEELTQEIFEEVEILRIDSDTTSRRDDYIKNVEKILNNKVSIIVGTQMITKGFDFPEIDTVGVMAADLSLNIPEYDATEKTFQLLMQVAGRSGRGKDKGKVIIQTYNPDHYSIRHVLDHDYESFFEEELYFRNLFNYPPFKRQYLITILNRNLSKGMEVSSKIMDSIDNEIKRLDLSENIQVVSNREKLSYTRINNRYHIKIYLNSTIRQEKKLKSILYNILIRNSMNIDYIGTYLDVVTR